MICINLFLTFVYRVEIVYQASKNVGKIIKRIMSVYNNVTTLISNATNVTHDECLAPSFTTLKVLYIILMSIILAVSLIGNSVVVISVMMSPILKSRQTYHFAASLGTYLFIHISFYFHSSRTLDPMAMVRLNHDCSDS